MANKIGVIAEDDTDINVIRELIKKIAHGKAFSVKPWAAGGCGKLVGKCRPWSNQLKQRGCDLLIILHDLDERQELQLRQQLESALNVSPISNYAIVIPVKEIEAWLLSDHLAIEKAMNLKVKISKIPNPQTISKPKEYLRDLIYQKSGKVKRYLTEDNCKIAQKVDINNLRRCASFVPLENFLRTHLQ